MRSAIICSYVQFHRFVSGLLTGFGLDFLAGKLSGPGIDSTTLQLIGLLLSSTLVPGTATKIF
eukprot:3435998-Amphidinium_carterae.1